MIDEYMESPEFYNFLNEHDDDVIHSTTKTSWSRALEAVLGKFPRFVQSGDQFPLSPTS